MNEIAGKLLTRNRGVSIFLYALGTALSVIMCWGFVLSIQQGLGYKEAIIAMPGQLQAAWFAIIGLICGGHEEEVNKVEKMLGKDLDGDGDIGGMNTPVPTETVQTAQIEPKQEVTTQDAENDASTYNIQRS